MAKHSPGLIILSSLVPILLLMACAHQTPLVKGPPSSFPLSTPVPSLTTIVPETGSKLMKSMSIPTSPVPAPSPRSRLVNPSSGQLTYTTLITVESPLRPLGVVLDEDRLFVTGNRRPGEYAGEILMYNLATHTMRSVAASSFGPTGAMTAMDASGDWLLWETHSGWGNDWILYVKNLATGEEILLDSAAQTGTQSVRGAYAAVSGNRVAWATLRKQNAESISDIRIYDTSRRSFFVLASAKMPEAVGFVDIQGNQVVWSQGSTAGGTKRSDVFMYDLASQRTAQLSHDGQSGQPTIWGDYVAWRQGFGEMGPIVLYNWKTGEETRLSAIGDFPRLGDDLACWEYYSSDVRSILYDLNKNVADGFLHFWRTGQAFAYDGLPSLWKRRVVLVYQDTQSEKWYLEVRQY